MNIKKQLRFLYHSVKSIKARRAGVDVAFGSYIAWRGEYLIERGSKIMIKNSSVLFDDHMLTAMENSNIYIGQRVQFCKGAKILAHPGSQIIIEDDCYFNHDVSIIAAQEVRIGRNSIFGPYCYLTDQNHGMAKNSPIKDQPFESEPLFVGSDVWLGVGVTVVKGAYIGEGAVIAARAVVTRHIPPYEIWGGIPAKRIGERQ